MAGVVAILIDGYALGAIVAALIAVVLLAVIAARVLKDRGYRVSRIGVFIERERVEDPPPDPAEQPTGEYDALP